MDPRVEIDDKGTNPAEAVELIINLRDQAFDGSDEKLAVALGRSLEEINGWQDGSMPIDSDVLMKARGIAMERGIQIE
jgi:hypothetical protein